MKYPQELVDVIIDGGLAVIPTDTIYGVVASAHNQQALAKLRLLKKRDETKAFIVLCSSVDQVRQFGVRDDLLEIAAQYWPGPTSIVLPDITAYPELQGDLDGVAFRVVANEDLKELLEKTGPLAAPSANPDGLPPAANIQEAKNYFNGDVDIYVDDGRKIGKPSMLIKISPSGETITLRA